MKLVSLITFCTVILCAVAHSCAMEIPDDYHYDSESDVIIETPKKRQKKPEHQESYQEIIDNHFDSITYQPPRRFIGDMPESAKNVIAALLSEQIRNKKLTPQLIQVKGDAQVGKTTLIRTIITLLGCLDKQYLEINKVDNFEKPLQTITFEDPSTLTSSELEINFENFIQNFHKKTSSSEKNFPFSIIAITNKLPFAAYGLLKLHDYIHKQTSQSNILVIFHEFTTNKLNKNKDDSFCYDAIIHLEKPTKPNIKKILANKFTELNIPVEKISHGVLNTLTGYVPVAIERIAENAARQSILKNSPQITNKLILEIINERKPLASSTIHAFYS